MNDFTPIDLSSLPDYPTCQYDTCPLCRKIGPIDGGGRCPDCGVDLVPITYSECPVCAMWVVDVEVMKHLLDLHGERSDIDDD